MAATRTVQERAILMTLTATGCRLGELIAMHTGDLTPDGLWLIHGKGMRERWVSLGRAGTVLRVYLNGQQGPVWTATEKHTPGRYIGQPLASRAIWEKLRHLGERAGVEHCHPHRFRVTFANRFMEAGGDLDALRSVMGHADIAMTAHYARWSATERGLTMQRRLAG
jgi:site-specific recombinase XerD